MMLRDTYSIAPPQAATTIPITIRLRVSFSMQRILADGRGCPHPQRCPPRSPSEGREHGLVLRGHPSRGPREQFAKDSVDPQWSGLLN
jgi:hypothetical protein